MLSLFVLQYNVNSTVYKDFSGLFNFNNYNFYSHTFYILRCAKSMKKNLQQFSYRVNSIKTRFELIFTLCNLRKAARHQVNFRPVIFNC